MSNSRRSSAKFWILSSVVVIASGAALACLWPTVRAQAATTSVQFVKQAGDTDGGEAWSDYQLATWLNPGNKSAYLGLAASQLAGGRASAALSSLHGAGQGSTVLRLKVRALIETGKYTEAQSDAGKLVSLANPPQADLVLAALADSLKGDSSDIVAITPRLSSPEAAELVTRAKSGNLPLAAALYATGLLNSSSAILTKIPSSFESDLLLAKIDYQWGTPRDLNRAAGLLQTATLMDPSSPAPRQLLVTIYRDENKFTLADNQQALVNKLTTGQP
jgi:hypothetical protein